MQYRRHYHQGASYFFTINLANRSSDLLIKEVETLGFAFKTVKQKHPFISMLLSSCQINCICYVQCQMMRLIILSVLDL